MKGALSEFYRTIHGISLENCVEIPEPFKGYELLTKHREFVRVDRFICENATVAAVDHASTREVV